MAAGEGRLFSHLEHFFHICIIAVFVKIQIVKSGFDKPMQVLQVATTTSLSLITAVQL